MNWEEIEKLAKDKNATEAELALHFLQSAGEAKSYYDLIRLSAIFLNPQCNLDNATIINGIRNLQTLPFRFVLCAETHYNPCMVPPRNRE